MGFRLQCFSALGLAAIAWSAGASAGDFLVTPAAVRLDGNFARTQLLVSGIENDGAISPRSDDLTGLASFSSSDNAIVHVDESGRLLAVADGQALITVTVDGASRDVPVVVAGIVANPVVGFDEHVLPVLSKAGCNTGACHASQHGKGNFILSVFHFDPWQDHQAITRDQMQRRVDPLAPEASLLLRKPTLEVPHGGGRRLVPGSVEYQVLRAWIASGMTRPWDDAPRVTRLTLEPPRRIGQVGLTQQYRVMAEYSDGASRDVTALARFDSLDDSLVSVDQQGRATVVARGQSGVMARYEGQAAISLIVVPYAPSVDLGDWRDQNFVDTHAANKFRELGIPPSPLCDDATFLRRAYLDATGTLPTVEQATTFLDSTDGDKRTRLVDALLGLTGDPTLDIHNDAYTAWWSLRWADLLKNSSQGLGERYMWSFHNWLKESFRTNKPFDQFVRELVTAKGSPVSVGPANFFLTAGNPLDLSESAAQLLLGVRLQCAKCHHHPFEKYGQRDYYGFAAFFQRVGTKYLQEHGVHSGENVVIVRSSGEMSAPRIGVVPPTPIDGLPVDHPTDRRIALADWLTAGDNNLLARNIANRYLGYLLGRGVVAPVDDLRATNPPSNPELLEALTADFRGGGYDLKRLIRTIMTSRLYQLSSQPTAENASDTRFYSHFQVKRLAAEPLLDAIDRVTGAQTQFRNANTGGAMPPGTRAIDLPDTNYTDQFLLTFAKPKRATVCECERTPDANLAQALHTLNGEMLAVKIATVDGRVARLDGQGRPQDEAVSELYLAALARRPTEAEMAASRDFLVEAGDPAEFYQDLLWALVNSKQFLFVH